jgi:dTDP-4-dehydrorhamnose reductase
MTRIIVAGGMGLFGCTLVPYLRSAGHDVKALGRGPNADLVTDLQDVESVWRVLDEADPDVVVNLAAFTDVDGCEDDPQAAYLQNVLIVQRLADWIGAHPGKHLVQLSTDHVYDGRGISSEEQVVIRNTYALSKRAGELAAASCASSVLRTNFFGRSRSATRTSFTDWLYASLCSRSPMQVFGDVFFSPLSMGTLARFVEKVVCVKPLGVYNVGSAHGMSKADFAFAFADTLGLPSGCMTRAQMEASSVIRTRRPRDMRMDACRFAAAVDVLLPPLMDEIYRMRSEYEGT